jgi:hypothetical protein
VKTREGIPEVGSSTKGRKYELCGLEKRVWVVRIFVISVTKLSWLRSKNVCLILISTF